jgi:hypothetical protein
MTNQPTFTTAPEAAPPTHAWRDTLFLVGGIVLFAVVGLVLTITVATSH